MTHLPYISAAYALGVGIPAIMAVLSWRRLKLAQKRLAVIDPRMSR
jgi:cytochrome c biogenesis protein CcdA